MNTRYKTIHEWDKCSYRIINIKIFYPMFYTYTRDGPGCGVMYCHVQCAWEREMWCNVLSRAVCRIRS